jgi:putative transposase
LPTIQQADLLVQTWVEQEYGPRPHRGLQMQSPLDIWSAGKGPGVDDGILWALLLSQEIKHVGRNGVTFLGVHYYDDALYGLKDRVMIRYDILDLSNILIFKSDGSDFICAARPVERIHPMAQMSDSPLDLQAVTDANKAKARLKKSTERDFRQLADGINFNFPTREIEQSRELTRPECEAIEAEAASRQVIDITPALPAGRPLFGDEIERYEWCAKEQAAGQVMTHEDIVFMHEFEQGPDYAQLKDYFKRVQEQG